ncbi:MAG: IS1595 family transposase, partial [Nitrospirae bacterium]|nr:IS1595 family transposase [Nitrospirota bacterium]
YRFNRRFHLKGLPVRLLVACATTGPCPERWLRLETEH